MKVALLSDCYVPRLGGIEVQVRGLAMQLAAAGHEVEVFTATAGANGESSGLREERDGLIVHRFALGTPLGPLRVPVNPLAVPELRRRLRAGRFDVAHAQMGVVSPFALDATRVALGLGLPTVVTWHCLLDRSRPLMAAAGYAARWARRGARLTAVSRLAAARVSDIAAGATVGVLPNGLDAALWSRPVDRPEPPERPFRVVAALRLARRKRPEALIEVLAHARDRVPPGVRLEATLLGDGPQREAVEMLLVARELPWVSLPGRVDRRILRETYWDSHVHLSTSRLEAFGLGMLEARAAGLPVLARSGTGAEDFLVDGRTAVLRDTDEGLAVALAELAADPQRWRSMATACRTDPIAQDWDAVLASTEAEYRAAGAR